MAGMSLVDIRLRSRISDTELENKLGKILGPADWNLLLTGPTYVRKPDGKPLCVYLPGAMAQLATDDVYRILHSMRTMRTDNRGDASGTVRLRKGEQRRTRTVPVASAVAGAMDPGGTQRYCRLTAWTGKHMPEWTELQPFLKGIAQQLATHVPDRYRAQADLAARTPGEWVVPGTPFTTITVNNTYPTGVHTDKGDLDEGFSTIACLRRGPWTGGELVFPRYRVAVSLKDTDLILMDAHEHHGNAAIVCQCGTKLAGMCTTCGAERISVVAYYRTAMATCGTADLEEQKAETMRARRAAMKAGAA